MLHIVAKGCGGNEFLDWVKKNLLATPHAKAQVKVEASYGNGA
jgi:hypothetical protein